MILALYNPEWPAEFAALRAVYMSSLGTLALRVEHVGSTAVPNLRAKPILDIDIVMPGYEVFPDIVAHLLRLGYTHNGDQGISERGIQTAGQQGTLYVATEKVDVTSSLRLSCEKP